MSRPDAAATNTLGLMVFGASITTGVMLLGLFTESLDTVEQDARQAAGSATTGLAPAVQVRSLSAERAPGGDGLGLLRAYLSAAPGAGGVPLSALAIEVRAGGAAKLFTLGAAPAGFSWSAALDPPPALDRDAPVVASNDLVEVSIHAAAAGLPLPPRTEGTLTFLTPDARPVKVPFRVPASLASLGVLELHRAEGPPRAWTFHPLDQP